MHYACYQGHLDIVDYLLQKGASLDRQSKSGCTALFFAVQQGHEKIARLLLLKGADPTIFEFSPNKFNALDVIHEKMSVEFRDQIRSHQNVKRPEQPEEAPLVEVKTTRARFQLCLDGSKHRISPRAVKIQLIRADSEEEGAIHEVFLKKIEASRTDFYIILRAASEKRPHMLLTNISYQLRYAIISVVGSSEYSPPSEPFLLKEDTFNPHQNKASFETWKNERPRTPTKEAMRIEPILRRARKVSDDNS